MAASIANRIENAPVFDIWRAPDMSVLAAGRRAPATMPVEMFGATWNLITDLAEGAGAPVDYVAISFITAAASLIGGKRKIRPFSTSNWSEPCIVWSACVGDPSSNKSPAIDSATAPLRTLEADHARDHGSRLLQWEATVERAKAELAAWADNVKTAQKDGLGTPSKPPEAVIPDEPTRRRLLVMDATPEAIGSILSGNPSGTLHLRDELAGWLLSFERYSPGGREFWLEAFGGRLHVIDRKGSKGPLTIPFNGVSVLGGIQPEKLSDCLLSGSDDGLVARFLWAWPDPIEFRRPRVIADVGQLEDIYRRIDSLSWGVSNDGEVAAVTLALDPKASDLFEEWGRENNKGLEDCGLLYKGFCGKLKGLVLRLALTAEITSWAASDSDAEPRSVSLQTLAATIEFIESYAKPTALRVFGDAALPAVERNASTLARYILRHRLSSFNGRALRRTAGLPGLKDASAFNEALGLLEDADWLRKVGTRAGETIGRMSSDYMVNPSVLSNREAANG